jgi:hypothetical protein
VLRVSKTLFILAQPDRAFFLVTAIYPMMPTVHLQTTGLLRSTCEVALSSLSTPWSSSLSFDGASRTRASKSRSHQSYSHLCRIAFFP